MPWPKVLITGGRGRLGTAIQSVASRAGRPVIAVGRDECDVTDPFMVAEAVRRIKPDVVVNAAARTAVDQCESEPELTFAVNAAGAGAVAAACAAAGVRCLHISTDYVFGDDGDAPHKEGATLRPVNIYGASKAEAEAQVFSAAPDALVVRTAWLFGDRTDDFIGRLLDISRQRTIVSVVNDQFGSPSPILGVAEGLLAVTQKLHDGGKLPSILHLAGRPAATRADWAETAFAAAAECGRPPISVKRVKSEAFPTPARRPLRTALDVASFERLIGPAPDWRTATEVSVRARLGSGERPEDSPV
jgi:dTDP-4-dehydrorhamnose reductase